MSRTPQQIAGQVSGRNRTERARHRRLRKLDGVRRIYEHVYGDHEGVVLIGCKLCLPPDGKLSSEQVRDFTA